MTYSPPPLSVTPPIPIHQKVWQENPVSFSDYDYTSPTSGYFGDSEWTESTSTSYDQSLDTDPHLGNPISHDQSLVTIGQEEAPSSLYSCNNLQTFFPEPIGVCPLNSSLIEEFKIFIESDIENDSSSWETFFSSQCLFLADAQNLSNLLIVYYNLWVSHFDFFVIDGTLENNLNQEGFQDNHKKLMKLRSILGTFFREQLYLLSEKNLHDNHLLRLTYDGFTHHQYLCELFSQDIFSLMLDERIKCRSQFIFIWELFLIHQSTFENFVKDPKLPIHAFSHSDRIKLEQPYDTDLQQTVLEKLKGMIINLNSVSVEASSIEC